MILQTFNAVSEGFKKVMIRTVNTDVVALTTLSENPQSLSNENISVFECFIILQYDRTSSHTDAKEARYKLFVKKGRSMDNIPPTNDALTLYV